ncbi:hypothetical protein IEO21_04261 [Rhodonia placenta]|uniref:NmrA-like domain-containing protein n=1 Tax=Rhodonia placenta TaxID=104341 RepID=A0A8H7U2N9_9APHY|nr:hypothetical protein IEO21_04261 [Postia placenta]
MALKPLVLVVGASGNTGKSVIPALLESGNFRVAATSRPSSLSKPDVNELRAKGVEIRPAEIGSDSVEQLKTVLTGVDILLSVVHFDVVLAQKSLFAAAKEAGVKRVIPCDFATPGAKGVRQLHDEKLAVRDYIKELGVGYTFIDVGWWMQLSTSIYGTGDKKLLLTDLNNIGKFVARILADERTLNQYVIVWEDELTWLEVKAICEQQSGEEDLLRSKRTTLSYEELKQRAAHSKEEYLRSPNFLAHIGWVSSEYAISMHILGENSLENAKALGALDARELYPDIVPVKFVDFAKKFYHKQ